MNAWRKKVVESRERLAIAMRGNGLHEHGKFTVDHVSAPLAISPVGKIACPVHATKPLMRPHTLSMRGHTAKALGGVQFLAGGRLVGGPMLSRLDGGMR